MTLFAFIVAIGAAISAGLMKVMKIRKIAEDDWPGDGETARETPNLPLSHPVEPVEVIPPPVAVPEPIKAPTLTQLCTAMRDVEGGPNDANYRNRNALNARFYDPKGTGTDSEYLPMYRPVRRSPAGFAIFPSMQIGWLYGFNMVKNKIKNHPDWTLLDLITDHAPAEDDNDPLAYAHVVASRLGVDIHYPVSAIVLA